MIFPEYRARRLRRNEIFRALVRETSISPAHLVYPLFVMPGKGKREEVPSMPGVFRLTVDQLGKEAKECMSLGVNNVILFGLPDKKDSRGSGAHAKDGIIQRAIKELKNKTPELMISTDVCLCEYTSHGHCGILIEEEVDNDATLEVLAKTALSHAQAGADMVAPSDMMDGRVAEIRGILDENNFHMVPIMSYAVKYASAFYGKCRPDGSGQCAGGPARGDPRCGRGRRYPHGQAGSRLPRHHRQAAGGVRSAHRRLPCER